MTLFERLKADAAAEWRSYVDHDFVRALGDGSLPEAAFRSYLVQDYLFLIQFARAYGLAVYKGGRLSDMRAAAATLHAILDVEMDLHVRVCAQWGLTERDLEAAEEGGACVAYTRFVLDAGLRGDLLDLLTALSPCVVGYAEIGAALARGGVAADNPYRSWIEEYAGSAYQQIAESARATLDRLGEERLTLTRYAELAKLFAAASRLEAAFWQAGLDAAAAR
ncbi:thiaminase II [Methylopila sp. Yamaguchi]|uniref:thiaminase II n=1 Tax=Methylopila sp. Yamaguchi TaxID=1437817 RepID=UPI000CC0068F|nr:thiaminase II [Methylopila sp. Yamaguchi]GBD49329.1 transcriptional activator [Methylopila sp. Yamaguchi]